MYTTVFFFRITRDGSKPHAILRGVIPGGTGLTTTNHPLMVLSLLKCGRTPENTTKTNYAARISLTMMGQRRSYSLRTMLKQSNDTADG